MGNMTTGLTGGLFTIVLLVIIGYFIRIDLADVTGMARENARKKMPSLADQLGYQIIASRTAQKQGGLEKNFGRYAVRVDGDKSRIQVEFKKSTGLRLSTLSQNDFDLGKLSPLSFANPELKRFFKMSGARDGLNRDALESALLPLVAGFDNRTLRYLYVKDEYLRVGFQHRGYIPASKIQESLSVLEQVAEKLVAVK